MLAKVTKGERWARPGLSTPLLQALPMIAFFVAAACLAAVTAHAQSPATTEILRRTFLGQEFEVQPFGPARWLEGGRSYTTLEPSAKGSLRRE